MAQHTLRTGLPRAPAPAGDPETAPDAVRSIDSNRRWLWPIVVAAAMLGATMAWSGQGLAAALNPDGFCGHPSLVLSVMATAEADRYPEILTYDGSETQFRYTFLGGAFGLVIPVSRYSTVQAGMSVSNVLPQRLNTYFAGITVYTRAAERPADLVNPDGKISTVAITPMLGLNTVGDQRPHTKPVRGENGLMAGLGLGYVAHDHVTICVDALYRWLVESGDAMVALGTRLHFNNAQPERGGFNPDGRPGSFCIEPSIGFLATGIGPHAVIAAIDVTVPVFPHLSAMVSGQYAALRSASFVGDQFGGGVGLALHP